MSDDAVTSVSSYEFNSEQGKLIAELGRAMRVVGLVAVAYAVLGIVLMGVAAWKTGVLAIDLNPILAIFLGLWAVSGGRAFLEAATTRGNDIGHLMFALGKLRNIFKLIAILMVAALLISAMVLIIVVFFRPAGSSIVVFGNPVG
jgi:hypothetical protein